MFGLCKYMYLLGTLPTYVTYTVLQPDQSRGVTIVFDCIRTYYMYQFTIQDGNLYTYVFIIRTFAPPENLGHSNLITLHITQRNKLKTITYANIVMWMVMQTFDWL